MTLANATTPDTRKVAVSHTIPAEAAKKAHEIASFVVGAARLEIEKINREKVEFKIGIRAKITRGWSEGKEGNIVDRRKGKYGVYYIVALTNKRSASGRYLDVAYAKPCNVRFVIPERDEKLKKLWEICNAYDFNYETAFASELLRLYAEAAAAWNADETVLLKRVVEVVEETIAQKQKYQRNLTENMWACDGRAYNQVERQSEGINKEIKNLKMVVSVVQAKVAKE